MVKSGETIDVAEGMPFGRTAPGINGYTFVGYRIDGVAETGTRAEIDSVSQAHTVTFVYRLNSPVKIPILIAFQDEQGAAIRGDERDTATLNGSYSKAAPALEGYQYLGYRIDGSVRQTGTVAGIATVTKVHSIIFVYRLSEPGSAYSMVLRYQSQNGEQLHPDDVEQAVGGATYRKSARELEGYTCVGHRIDNGSLNSGLEAVVPSVAQERVITFVYSQDDPGSDTHYALTLEYLDRSGNTVRSSDLISVKAGSAFTRIAPGIYGFNCVGCRLDGVDQGTDPQIYIPQVTRPHLVTFIYEPREPELTLYSVTLRYQDTQGGTIHATDTEQAPENGTYTKSARIISGYECTGYQIDNGVQQSGAVATISEMLQNHTITFIYRESNPDKQKYTITIHYRDQQQASVRPSDQEQVVEGEPYSVSAPAISGYSCTGYRIDGGAQQSGTTASIPAVNQAHTITFVYQTGGLDEFPITLRFQDQSGATVKAAETEYAVQGTAYSKPAPAISGYSCTGYRIDGGAQQSGTTASIPAVNQAHTITFVYQTGGLDEFPITLRFQDQSGATVKAAETEYAVQGTAYSKPAPAISGYSCTGYRIDGGAQQSGTTASIPAVNQAHTITFVYQTGGLDEFPITLRFQDQSGATVKAAETEYAVQGAAYSKPAPAISGYSCTGYRIDGGAQQSGTTASIPAVNQAHTITFVYQTGGLDEFPITLRFQDQSGAAVKAAETEYAMQGAAYSKSAPAISGYSCTGYRIDGGAQQSGTTASIPAVNQAHTITFVYRTGGLDEFPITLRFQDQSGATVKAAETEYAMQGAAYSKSAPAISGYSCTGYRIDGGAQQSGTTASIPAVNQAYTITFVYQTDSLDGGSDNNGQNTDGKGNNYGTIRIVGSEGHVHIHCRYENCPLKAIQKS